MHAIFSGRQCSMTDRNDTEYLRPLNREPVSVQVPFISYPRNGYRYECVDERRAALLAALEGVELGTYDRYIVHWLALQELPTAATVVSLLLRTRDAGAQQACGDET